MNGIVIALIGAGASIVVGVLTLVGVIYANNKANEKLNAELQSQLKTAQAVTDTKIEELTREVREHNNFARRMPVVESEIAHIEDDVRRLRKYHEGG